jgi:tetratricopeptide (TPR) repeat protein
MYQRALVWGIVMALLGIMGCGDGSENQKPQQDAQPWLPSYQAGMAKMDEGNFDAARREFDRTVSLGPQFFEGWYNRGICLATTGQDSLAAESFTRAIEIKPSNPDAWYHRGKSYGKSQKWELALADLNQVEALKAGYPGAKLESGIAKWNLGDAEGACTDFKAAEKQGDPDAGTWAKRHCK